MVDGRIARVARGLDFKRESEMAKAAKKDSRKDPRFLAAGYEAYPSDFSSNYFSASTVVSSVRNIKAAGFTRDNLLWGYYQKYAPSDPTDQSNWTDTNLYMNWESAVAEARDALRKLPADPTGPDPDNPMPASHMLDHLDKAVKIALFDKHLANNSTDSGIEIEVVVGTQTNSSRRHKITTSWRRVASNPSDPKYKHDKLTIVMTCPKGGWIGTAAWKYAGPSKFTQYTATYKVPATPNKAGQILFIFNGLESLPDPQQSYPPGILQPVLQWTQGDGWAIRSWYVPATYTPSIDQMPPLNNERKFTNPGCPAWTKAEKVAVNTVLQGVIAWNNNMAYQSSFVVGGTTKAMLLAPNILPLTYPVAVIEAYNFGSNKNNLVDVTMDGLTLYREDSPDVPVEPTWDTGTDSNPVDGIHYGTGRLQRYTITPSNNNATLTFTRK
jgi:hypothetical protein